MRLYSSDFSRMSPVLRPHRLATVKLQGEDAFAEGEVGMVVGEVEDQSPVHVVSNVIPFCHDHYIVPVVETEEFLESSGVNQFGTEEALPVFLPGGSLADEADASPLALLVVNESGHAGEIVLVANLVLIALDDPIVARLFEMLGSVLNTGIVRG